MSPERRRNVTGMSPEWHRNVTGMSPECRWNIELEHLNKGDNHSSAFPQWGHQGNESESARGWQVKRRANLKTAPVCDIRTGAGKGSHGRSQVSALNTAVGAGSSRPHAHAHLKTMPMLFVCSIAECIKLSHTMVKWKIV